VKQTSASNGYEFVMELLVNDGDETRKSRNIIMKKEYEMLGIKNDAKHKMGHTVCIYATYM
jgi:hypothetical protein